MPLDLNFEMAKYKSTTVHKHDSERALLSWFLAQYQKIDADLIVTFDSMDCQLNVITDQIVALKIPQWSRMGRLRLSQSFGKRLLEHFVGRMVCDVKRSAEECIRARSYDLQTLCKQVLKLKESGLSVEFTIQKLGSAVPQPKEAPLKMKNSCL